MSADEFGGLIKSEFKTYGDFVKKTGITAN